MPGLDNNQGTKRGRKIDKNNNNAQMDGEGGNSNSEENYDQ